MKRLAMTVALAVLTGCSSAQTEPADGPQSATAQDESATQTPAPVKVQERVEPSSNPLYRGHGVDAGSY
jgi:uncharacterized lipoprotein YmbA